MKMRSVTLLLVLVVSAACAQAQPARKAVVNGNYWEHQAGNVGNFLYRAPVGWSCSVAGQGDANVSGLNWNPSDGPAVIQHAASESFDIVVYYGDGTVDPVIVDNAAQNGCAVFCFHSGPNNHHCLDYRSTWSGIRGKGPTPAMIVSGGFSDSPGAGLAYGPQGEFIDAVTDRGDWAQSWAHSSSAAKYAKLKDLHPSWNVFDLRQTLRQTCTFYSTGWREDGGYGFPKILNRGDVNGNPPFTEATIPATLTSLDAGPPIQPSAEVVPNDGEITFKWYNFRQTGFLSTLIKVNGTTIYEGDDTSFTWTPNISGAVTAEFFTKVDDGSQVKLSRTESYTQVSIYPLFASGGQFISESAFQFTINGLPGTSVSIYSSSDLNGWQFRSSVTLANGTATFTDNEVGGVNYRFYRVGRGDFCSRAACSGVLGFTRVTVPGNGSKLIANQLDAFPNTLANLLPNPPDGAQIRKWDGSAYVTSTFQNGAWSDGTATLDPGEGAFFVNPGSQAYTVTFIGQVRQGILNPSVPAGWSIRSSMLPQAGGVFSLGYPPQLEEVVLRWNGNGYDYYNLDPDLGDPEDPGGWYPSEPRMEVGEAFWSHLNTAATGFQSLEACVAPTYCTAPLLSEGSFLSPGEFRFTLTGEVGENADIYSSTDLLNWTFRSTTTLSDGAGSFTDSQVAGVNYRFYRVDKGHDCASAIIGFVHRTVPTNGSIMIANQLDAPPNTLNSLLPNPPLGTQINKWTGAAYAVYTYQLDGNNHPGWSPNGDATLLPGEGAFIFNPASTPLTVTFVGKVREGLLINPIPAGSSIKSCVIPMAGLLSSALSYPANNFDSIFRWTGSGYQSYSFDPDVPGWTEQPNIEVGEAFWIQTGTSRDWRKDYFGPCLVSGCAVPSLTDGHFVSSTEYQFTISGTDLSTVGGVVKLYASSDLRSWTLINSVTLPGGSVTYTDNQVSGLATRFYRVSQDRYNWFLDPDLISESIRASQIIGFTRVTLPGNGSAILANQLNARPNTLAHLLSNVPLGTQVNKWTGSAYATYTFQLDGNGNPAWSPQDTTLPIGEGFFLLNPSAQPLTVTFSGTVPEGNLSLSIPAGTSLRGSMVPEAGPMATLLHYPPSDFDSIFKWTGSGYESYSYDPDIPGWSAEPVLNAGEGVWIQTGSAKNWTRVFRAFP